MGCDIHIRTELQRTIDGKKVWTDIDTYVRNPYARNFKDQFDLLPIYDGRNYNLFAALADVRNSGFITPISQPKGLPDDTNQYIAHDAEKWGLDGHSFSYLTLKELLEHRKDYAVITQQGLISKEAAEALDLHGVLPESWCQGTSDKTYVLRSWKREVDLLSVIIDPIVQRVRNMDYAWYTDEELLKNADKVRIVFWFDN